MLFHQYLGDASDDSLTDGSDSINTQDLLTTAITTAGDVAAAALTPRTVIVQQSPGSIPSNYPGGYPSGAPPLQTSRTLMTLLLLGGGLWLYSATKKA